MEAQWLDFNKRKINWIPRSQKQASHTSTWHNITSQCLQPCLSSGHVFERIERDETCVIWTPCKVASFEEFIYWKMIRAYFNNFLTECLCLVAQVVWCAGKANHCWGGMLFLFLDQWFASQNGEEGTLTHSLHVRVEFLGRDFMQVYFFARTSQHGRVCDMMKQM